MINKGNVKFILQNYLDGLPKFDETTPPYFWNVAWKDPNDLKPDEKIQLHKNMLKHKIKENETTIYNTTSRHAEIIDNEGILQNTIYQWPYLYKLSWFY